MAQHPTRARGAAPAERRNGFTLAELLVAMVITAILAGIAAVLAEATFVGNRYSRGHAEATQHARVTLQRISRTVSDAYASKGHPGVAVVYQTIDGYQLPDTLVVWSPTTTPVNTAGPPLIKECVFYCCDPTDPKRLVELRAPNDTRTIPLNDTINAAPWPTDIATLKTAVTTTKVVLTDLVHTATTNFGTTLGAVRFERILRPTQTELDYYPSVGPWSALSWPQDLRGTTNGIRQSTVRIELQLAPGESSTVLDTQGLQSIPFVGSAALLYKVDAS